MMKTRTATLATYGMLGLATAMTFMLPRSLTVPSSSAAGGADEVTINGVIRDFQKSHPDFNVIPSKGLGHYAGSVNTWLPGTRRPLFVSGGYKVEDQWYDADGRSIAPHMAGVRGGLARDTLGFRLNGTIELKKDTWIDAFDSNYGPYGVDGNFGQNVVITTNSTSTGAVTIDKKGFIRGDVYVGVGGTPAEVIANKGIITGAQRASEASYEMPDLTLPEDLDSYEDALVVIGNVTLTGDTTPDDEADDPAMHVGMLDVRPGAILTIEGDLRIRCDKGVKIDKAQITLLPDSNLSIFVSNVAGGNGDVEIKESLINTDEGDTTLVSINALGPGKLEIEKKSHVYATIVAPQRRLDVKEEAHFYGGLIADALKVDKKGSAVHVDLGNAAVGNANFALSVREEIKLDNGSEIDSFDSNDGPYGGANQGQNAWVSTNAIQEKEKIELKANSTIGGDVMIGPFGDMSKVLKIDGGSSITGAIGQLATPYAIPVVAPPAFAGTASDVTYDGGTHTISGDLLCKKLKLENGAIVNISGDVVIRCDDKVELKKNSEIRLNAGATLTLYVKKEIKLEEKSLINMNTGNPQLVSIRMMSLGKKGKISLKQESKVCAWAMGAKSELKIEDKSEFFGSFTGSKIEMKQQSKMHVDMAYLIDCVTVMDTAGVKGVEHTGAITSAESFDEWFRTILGLNQAIGHPITLTRGMDGIYSYLDDEFHPIDDKLLGNETQLHNNHFTYAIGATFTYAACAGDFVEFTGGDGAWLYIDNQLVMDLGGVGATAGQYVALDRLGLEDGKEYALRLFYADRRSGDATFRLRTSLELDSDNVIPSVLAMFD